MDTSWLQNIICVENDKSNSRDGILMEIPEHYRIIIEEQ